MTPLTTGNGNPRPAPKSRPPSATLVIYVDVDGVLTTENHQRETWAGALDPVAVGLLASLIERFSARVVVSSTWRKLPDCRRFLVEAGLPPGCFHADWGTAILPGSVDHDGAMKSAETADRGREISEHVARNRISRYLVLDDVDCGHAHAGRQVRPDPSVGLTASDAVLAACLAGGSVMAA